jgi:hypothetical protein
MAESGQGAQGAGEEHREPFVSQGDRPEVRLDPDKPLSELRVRDLTQILGGGMAWKHLDGPIPGGSVVGAKAHSAENAIKNIIDNKPTKWDKNEFSKAELFLEPGIPAPPFGPGPDPRLEQVIQAVSGLNIKISQVADQMAEMQRRLEG